MPKGKSEAVSRRRTDNTMVWFNLVLALCCLTTLSTILQLYRGGQCQREKDKNVSIKHYTELTIDQHEPH